MGRISFPEAICPALYFSVTNRYKENCSYASIDCVQTSIQDQISSDFLISCLMLNYFSNWLRVITLCEKYHFSSIVVPTAGVIKIKRFQ